MWILYLQLKDEFIDAFQTWFLKIENKSGQSIKILYTDGGREFISIKLRYFYNKKGIILKYVVSYMHKKKNIVEKSWQTIVTIKDLLLLNNGLLLDF